MSYDYFRLHLVPRCALAKNVSTLEDCIAHAGRVADALVRGFADSSHRTVTFDPCPSKGGMRYALRSQKIEAMYGVFFGDYFDSEILSERMRRRNPGSPPALKSYLLVADPFGARERALIAASITMHTDLIINHEVGYPKGWQAFLQRYENMGEEEGFKMKASNIKYGSALLGRLGIAPSEWVACTASGYERRGGRLHS